jgi:hypothetical protein
MISKFLDHIAAMTTEVSPKAKENLENRRAREKDNKSIKI